MVDLQGGWTYTATFGDWINGKRRRVTLVPTAVQGVARYVTSYKVSVKTGNEMGAGTDADIAIRLLGSEGESDEILLGNTKDAQTGHRKNLFERNQVRVFFVGECIATSCFFCVAHACAMATLIPILAQPVQRCQHVSADARRPAPARSWTPSTCPPPTWASCSRSSSATARSAPPRAPCPRCWATPGSWPGWRSPTATAASPLGAPPHGGGE